MDSIHYQEVSKQTADFPNDSMAAIKQSLNDNELQNERKTDNKHLQKERKSVQNNVAVNNDDGLG